MQVYLNVIDSERIMLLSFTDSLSDKAFFPFIGVIFDYDHLQFTSYVLQEFYLSPL